MSRTRIGAEGMRVCRTCSHRVSPIVQHGCPHGPEVTCHWCERVWRQGRNMRNRQLYPRAKEMFDAGVSCYRIAKELDIGYETVKRWFRRRQSPFRIVTKYQATVSPTTRRPSAQISGVPRSSQWSRWR